MEPNPRALDPAVAPPSAALLTPRGRGAVATVRYVGECRRIDDAARPLFRAANGKPLAAQPLGRIVFGHWGSEPAEEIVVCRVADQTLDLHCHGGEAAVRRILGDLESVGCGRLSWQELSLRTAGLFETECLAALSQATTHRTAEILLEQQSGVLRHAVENARDEAAGWPGLEALRSPGIVDAGALDRGFPPFGRSSPGHPAESRIAALLAWADFGLHLTRPWDVVLFGRPNVGKSSLINALVGYSRSIVFDQPGTTRDVVTADTALEGWPVRLSDTAGLRAEAERLESAGIDLARRRLVEADCRVLLLDTGRPPHEDDRRLLAEWPGAVVVAHKSDLPDAWGDALPAAALRVSSVTGDGVKELTRELVRRLVPCVPPPGTPVPFTARQVDLLHTARAAAARGDAVARDAALRAFVA